MTNAKCKICRRAGTKLFLKGEKCNSPHCPLLKKSYPPGEKGKRMGGRRRSEYGKELMEKQKLRSLYNLKEKQFRKYVEEVLEKRGQIENASEVLIQKLERRLDNVVFRLGFASSRNQARQLVSHGHFLVNEKETNIPSFQVKKGDTIKLRKKSKGKAAFKNLSRTLKDYEVASWLKLDKKKFEGEVVGAPSLEEISIPVKVPSIFEYYSR